MLTIHQETIDFEDATNVISNAQKFILPIPKLTDGGEPLVYNEGSDKGKLILNWEGKPIGERGLLFYNHKDNAIQAVQGDGIGVVIINLVDQECADKLDAKIRSYNTDINKLTLDNLKNIISFAHNELKLEDMYNSDRTFVQTKMMPINNQEVEACYGLYKRNDRNICQAVYIEGEGEFCGPSVSPQKFKQGAVIIKQDQDHRLIQPDIFIKTYKHPDYSNIGLEDIKVLVPENIVNNNKLTAVQKLNLSRAESGPRSFQL